MILVILQASTYSRAPKGLSTRMRATRFKLQCLELRGWATYWGVGLMGQRKLLCYNRVYIGVIQAQWKRTWKLLFRV